MKSRLVVLLVSGFSLVAAASVGAAETVVDMHLVTAKGIGNKIGTVSFKETDYGTLVVPKLAGLAAGLHGFHVHAKGSCEPAEKDGKMVPAMAAGGHLDPDDTKSHNGPYEKGHLGDLPALYADSSGKAEHPVLAPRIRIADLPGHALMIHAGGDNYADTPEELGGGGARVACGVIN